MGKKIFFVQVKRDEFAHVLKTLEILKIDINKYVGDIDSKNLIRSEFDNDILILHCLRKDFLEILKINKCEYEIIEK